jgi:toxin FitB
MILVDTNVWSEMTKRNREPRVMAWLTDNEPQLRLSVLVIAEARRGYELPSARAIKPMLENWLSHLESTYADRIEPFDARDAHIYGQLAAQRTVGGKVLDIQLAAQAIARNIPLATRNVADFAWTGVKLVNPWEK